jgi:RNA polymerase sigma factor (sigma-70 family)
VQLCDAPTGYRSAMHADAGSFELGLLRDGAERTRLDSRAAARSRARTRTTRMGIKPGQDDADGSHLADFDLVQRAAARDARALDEVIDRLACLPAMLRALHRRLSSPLSTDELAEVDQSTLAALWAKLLEYEGRASLETWAFRFAQLELHKALDRRRRNARLRLADEAQLAELEQHAADSPELEPGTVRSCIEQLGSPTAEIVRLRHYDECSFEDIAMRRSESVSSVKARYYRGLERLRGLLGPHLRRQA